MELSRQMLLLTAVNYGSYYLHITILFFNIGQDEGSASILHRFNKRIR